MTGTQPFPGFPRPMAAFLEALYQSWQAAQEEGRNPGVVMVLGTTEQAITDGFMGPFLESQLKPFKWAVSSYAGLQIMGLSVIGVTPQTHLGVRGLMAAHVYVVDDVPEWLIDAVMPCLASTGGQIWRAEEVTT